MNIKLSLFVCIVLFPTLAGMPLQAQDDTMDGPGRKKIEELRKIKMIEALELTEDQAVRLTVRERDFRKSEQELMQQRQQLIQQLKESLQGSSNDADIERMVTQITGFTSEILKKRQEYLLSLKDLLTMKQIGQLVVFEDSFSKELRKALQGYRKGPPRH